MLKNDETAETLHNKINEDVSMMEKKCSLFKKRTEELLDMKYSGKCFKSDKDGCVTFYRFGKVGKIGWYDSIWTFLGCGALCYISVDCTEVHHNDVNENRCVSFDIYNDFEVRGLTEIEKAEFDEIVENVRLSKNMSDMDGVHLDINDMVCLIVDGEMDCGRVCLFDIDRQMVCVERNNGTMIFRKGEELKRCK